MALSTAKGISIMFDEILELYDFDNNLARQCDVVDFEASLMQNSVNIIWRSVEQNAPIKEGWDMSAQFGDVIERAYPSSLGLPQNDAFQLRADDFRDERFMKNRARAAVAKLSGDQNKRIAQLVVNTGALAYEYTGAAGYDYLAQAEAIMDELELSNMGNRSFFLRPVTHQAIAKDLAQRGTLSGRPEGAYAKSMVGKDIAGFDVFRANAIPTMAEQATAVTVNGNQSFTPEGSTTNADGTVVPVDYRSAVLTVSTTVGLNVGDKFSVAGMNSVSLGNKIDTGRLATFTIVSIPSGTTIEIFPKPIAWDERPVADGGSGALSAEQAAYANVTTAFNNTDALVYINDNGAPNNLWTPDVFWTNDSIEIVNGNAPFEFMSKMDGFTVIKETLDSGVTVYMMYQGSIGTATLQCRVFTWYGLVNRKPQQNGVALPNFS